MATTQVDISELKQQFARKNLERLSGLEPPEPPEEGYPDDVGQCKLTLRLLQQWSQDNASTLQTAIQQQAFSGKDPINWTNAFLPFMESMAVYLRDHSKVVEAWNLYRDFKASGSNDIDKAETAISIYQDANYDIDVLAKEWGMDFVILCDLVDQFPKDHQTWDGPFCGAFFTTAAQQTAPFIGIAFKGTKPTRKAEVLVDSHYEQTAAERLDGTHCSLGVYTGLFGTFDPPNDPPYNNILSETQKLAKTLPNSLGQAVRTHVTGHSLGGSYSTFCFTRLIIDVAPDTLPITIGNEYTFGAPRVGSDDYATLNSKLVEIQHGQSWRIVNNKDIVPLVPPTEIPPKTPERLHFHHIDIGMQIFPDKTPQVLPSEIGRP